MSALNVRELGDFIRDQRRTAQISLRQLAKQAGVSNPYLSQIERGLRRPSAEILQQIAKALRISAEALYVQAGILEERHGGDSVMAAVLADESLSERQKQVVLDIYEAFCKENAVANHTAAAEKRTTADQTGAGRPVATGTPVKVRGTTPRAPRRTATTGTTGTTGTTTTGTTTTGTAATASAAGTSVTTPRSTRTSRSTRAVRASGTASKPAAAPKADAAPGTSTATNVDPAATPGGTEQPEG